MQKLRLNLMNLEKVKKIKSKFFKENREEKVNFLRKIERKK